MENGFSIGQAAWSEKIKSYIIEQSGHLKHLKTRDDDGIQCVGDSIEKNLPKELNQTLFLLINRYQLSWVKWSL